MKSVNQNFSMSIHVDGKEIPEYSHDGAIFIEGRAGSEYVIRVRNNTYRRSCCVVSVDGLSVINGDEASDKSPGYVLNAYETLNIACYKVDSSTGAKFVFSAKDKSYTAEIGHGTNNVGVIALKAFLEKPAYRHNIYPLADVCTGFGAGHSSGSHTKSLRSKVYGSSGSGIQASSANMKLMKSSRGWDLEDQPMNSMGTESLSAQCSTSEAPRGIAPSVTNMVQAEVNDMVDTKLGTAFGELMKWETTSVTFDREAHPDSSLIIYYDSRKNLERRGIKFSVTAPPLPNPFPGNEGCPTPKGWRK